MKGKFEDKLAQLAFGDLSPEEAAKLERDVQGDPEALRTLSLYKDMRAGLRSMSAIPEDQFSKERLRDAILTQGLKPVPTRPVSNRTWLWMPLAACVLGFAMMYGQGKFLSHKPTQVVINPDLTLGPKKDASIDFKPSPPSLVAMNPSKPKAVDPKSVTPKAESDEVDPRILVTMPTYEDSYDPDLGKLPEGTASVNAGTVAAVTDHKPTAASTPIVLIDQDTDEQTGACKATEVGSSSNVLVGG